MVVTVLQFKVEKISQDYSECNILILYLAHLLHLQNCLVLQECMVLRWHLLTSWVSTAKIFPLRCSHENCQEIENQQRPKLLHRCMFRRKD